LLARPRRADSWRNIRDWDIRKLLSSTQRENYKRGGGLPMALWKEKVQLGVPFEDLELQDYVVLAQAWRNVRGNGTIFGLAVEGIDKFQVVHWCKDELADAYVIPMFAQEATLEAFRPVTFKQWVETKPKVPLHPNHAWDAGEASSTRHRHNQDPALATRIQLFTMVQPSEKAIGVIDAYILLDGYHRAVWFWKRETSTERLSVYVPA
jgi:hypothetical protein